ncbi:MAG TPA: glycosyltransferase, partial [Terriglobales bacterium]|nr:glycosyltransferase [Terriglobales bacterium]
VCETSSLLAIEAMAAGTPVIAWRSGALPEIVRDGKTGFIVTTVQDMAEAIREVHRVDRQVCRREAERRFGAREMLTGYVSLYERVVAQSNALELQAA